MIASLGAAVRPGQHDVCKALVSVPSRTRGSAPCTSILVSFEKHPTQITKEKKMTLVLFLNENQSNFRH